VVAVGCGYDENYYIGDWTDIVQIAAGFEHTVGLRTDGTVVAVGVNEDGRCNVSGWTDIVQVSAGYYHTVGFQANGTVVAVGANDQGQCDVSDWTDIMQVAAGHYHTIGVKSDGTAVAAGAGLEFAKWNLGIITESTLTTSSTVGGAVITPGEESFDYNAGTMVHLVAKPDAGYRFVNWTGDVGAIFNVNAASTVITMHGDYSITANFKARVNWALIGGIIAAVVAVGLVIFFMRRRGRGPADT